MDSGCFVTGLAPSIWQQAVLDPIQAAAGTGCGLRPACGGPECVFFLAGLMGPVM
jgi:hypothetical protein